MTSTLLNESREEFAGFMTRLQDQLASLQQVAPPEPQLSNKIFQAPAATDLFTGRMALLNQVKEAFGLVTYPFVDDAAEPSRSSNSILLSSPLPTAGKALDLVQPRSGTKSSHDHSFGYRRRQKRFILVGLGGSSKTEFCRKFAEQNQPR